MTDRIELRIAPAVDTLRALPTDRSIDLAFIDADKPNYVNYYEELVPRMRANGLILVDNVLWSGAVVDPKANDSNVEAIRRFNDHLAADPRVTAHLDPQAITALLDPTAYTGLCAEMAHDGAQRARQAAGEIRRE